MKSLLPVLLLALLTTSCSRADSWGSPSLTVTASPDGSVLLRISPGSRSDEQSHASAAVLRFDAPSGSYLKIAEFSLRNSSAPHAALITNDAKFIVTFDDWGSIGRTENVVVVYRGTGELIRSWRLSDIFPMEERNKFLSTVTSTWWRGDVELVESPRQVPTVIIRPETQLSGLLDENRKSKNVLLFDVLKMSFKKG